MRCLSRPPPSGERASGLGGSTFALLALLLAAPSGPSAMCFLRPARGFGWPDPRLNRSVTTPSLSCHAALIVKIASIPLILSKIQSLELFFPRDFLPFTAMACDLCGGFAFWRDRGGAAGGFVCLLCVVFFVSAFFAFAHGRIGVCRSGFSDFGGGENLSDG